MKRGSTSIVCLFVFTLCSSMSQCFKNDTPGPMTTVHGVIKDYQTGEPFANVVLQIIRKNTEVYSKYTDFDTVVTKPDGSYSLKFTPIGSGDFSIYINDHNYLGQYNNFISQNTFGALNLGQDNTVNFPVQKLINLKFNYKNSSTQGKNYYNLSVDACCYVPGLSLYSSLGAAPVITNFSIPLRIPQLSYIRIQTVYYSTVGQSGFNTGLPIDTVVIRHSFNSGKNDTTVTIINP